MQQADKRIVKYYEIPKNAPSKTYSLKIQNISVKNHEEGSDECTGRDSLSF
jgi:hypothetical protein